MNDGKSNSHGGAEEIPSITNWSKFREFCRSRFNWEVPWDVSDRGSQPEETRSAAMPDARLSPKGASRNRAFEQVGGLRMVALGDLISEQPEECRWLVEGLLPIGGVSILGARPKVGKSTLARNLALSVAKGIPFLGLATKQGPVVYLALEEKRSEVRLHFEQMGATEEPIYVHFGIAPKEEEKAIRAVIAHYKPVLVIIDPLLRLVRVKDSNAYGEVTQALEPYVQLARSSGSHLMFVHHMVKNDRTGAEGLLGSTAIFGAVDTAIMMNRREHVRTIETSQRYGEDLPATVLSYDRITGLLARDRTTADAQQDTLAAKVCAVLVQGTLNEVEIRTRMGGDQTEVAKALRLLVENGVVIRSGMGRKGSPYQYHLAGTTNQSSIKPSVSDQIAQQSVDQTGWPTMVEGLGPRVTGAFAHCVRCGEGTWNRYGGTPLCLADARKEMGKHCAAERHETEEGGDDNAMEE